MTKCHTPTPAAQFTSEAGPPMSSQHVMPDPSPPAWDTPTLSSSGSFLRVGSVVPVSVLSFNEDGSTQGFLAQQVADTLVAEIRAELDALAIVYVPAPWPGPRSGACLTKWSAGNGLSWQCSLPKKHDPAIPCEAQAPKGAVLAAKGQERTDTTALKPTVRKRTPKAVA